MMKRESQESTDGSNRRQTGETSVPDIHIIDCDGGPKTIRDPRREGYQERRNGTMGFTFREIDIALPVVEVETPEKAGAEVQQNTANIVAKPRPGRPRKRFPRPSWK